MINKFAIYYYEIEIEQGLTSHQTHYRSYQGRFLQVIWPNQQCQRKPVDLADKDTADAKLNATYRCCLELQLKMLGMFFWDTVYIYILK